MMIFNMTNFRVKHHGALQALPGIELAVEIGFWFFDNLRGTQLIISAITPRPALDESWDL